MRFRWDWLAPVMHAPYVPTLGPVGPVGPGALSVELFNDVLDVAGTGRFLSYDKDRRWSDRKDEQVIVEEISHLPEMTVIPTLSTRGDGLVKIHYYGKGRPDLTELHEYGAKLCALYGAGRHRIIWCEQTSEGASGRLMLKTFSDRDVDAQDVVMQLSDCPYADTFPAFTQEIGPEGFMFLYQRMQAGSDDGPVLVTVEDNRIVGAVGPLGILHDRDGVRVQPPQYFAVHPTYRGRGHGRALWRASMAWGQTNGATYKVLQAATGSPAESLYLSEGLQTLGFVHTA